MRLAWLGAGATVGILVLASSGCSSGAPSADPAVRASAQAIQDGSTDTTDKFAVGLQILTGNSYARCSGALILPNLVATARHCVSDSPELIDCSQNPTFGSLRGGTLRITTNTTMDPAASGWFDVKQIITPTDAHICGNDIALIILTSSVPASVAKPITPGVQYQMWDSSKFQPAFIGIGYGKTSPAPDDTSGTRRISKPISVLCVPGAGDPTLACPSNVPINAAEFIGGDGPCQGDSGSSAYETSSFNAGAPVSFGVLSRGGENQQGTVCQNSIYTRFDAHRDFVLQVAQQASQNWTLYPEPAWTGAPVTPGSAGTDGGASSSSSGGASSSGAAAGAALGETCDSESQCASGHCSDPGDGNKVCSQPCDASDSASCPDGFECRNSLCLTPAPAAAAPVTTTTTTTGCAAAPGPSSSAGFWAVLGAAFGLSALRRKRR